jgi:hypothetical protein
MNSLLFKRYSFKTLELPPKLGGARLCSVKRSRGLFLQVLDFQQGQTQIADGVQDASQGGLINDLRDQHRLALLLPKQGESAKAGGLRLIVALLIPACSST